MLSAPTCEPWSMCLTGLLGTPALWPAGSPKSSGNWLRLCLVSEHKAILPSLIFHLWHLAVLFLFWQIGAHSEARLKKGRTELQLGRLWCPGQRRWEEGPGPAWTVQNLWLVTSDLRHQLDTACTFCFSICNSTIPTQGADDQPQLHYLGGCCFFFFFKIKTKHFDHWIDCQLWAFGWGLKEQELLFFSIDLSFLWQFYAKIWTNKINLTSFNFHCSEVFIFWP